MLKRKPIIKKFTVECHWCKGSKEGCRFCEKGRQTSHYLIVNKKGDGFFVDALK